MDQNLLVEGGAAGLARIADAFRTRGLPISGVYLVKLTSVEGYEEWVIRLISDTKMPDMKRKMVYELVRLRNEPSFPRVASSVRFDLVSEDDTEASRVIDYARRLGGLPVTIEDAMWKGLFIEYALVADIPHASMARA